MKMAVFPPNSKTEVESRRAQGARPSGRFNVNLADGSPKRQTTPTVKRRERRAPAIRRGWKVLFTSVFRLNSLVAWLCFLTCLVCGAADTSFPPGYTIPIVDLSAETNRQVIVDREPGQYLGHPTTVLLEDGRTILCVYPKGHGRGALILKRSTDGGRTWSDRLPVPENWATSLETPSIHRVVDASGKKRLIVWSGFNPARLAVSEDDGVNWTPLRPAGDWGGIVVMGSVERLRDTPGHYLALFHDDGRFIRRDAKQEKPVVFRLYQTESTDGGLTWNQPRELFQSSEIHLCEPGLIRSPDGKQMAVLLRENSRRRNSHVIFSNDEGGTWTQPRELPAALTGDRHTGKYAPDGRLFLSFRDTTRESPTKGDWVGWVGTYDDIVQGREGQYRVRIMDNTKAADCAYPGVEVLPDGTFVTTTYGHWTTGEQPYIASVRFTLAELDARRKTTSTPSPERVILETELGNIEIELNARQAPRTTGNFLRYVKAGFYDGGVFHRAVTLANQPANPVKIEVIQAAMNRGKEKEAFPPISIERTRDTGLRHLDGTVSMAREGPDTAQHHFFICIGDQPALDFGGARNPDGQGFAAFGKVVRGLEVARRIQQAPAEGQALAPPIKILRATLKMN
jgi:cyclophilin family peptidyl-prolyl cis-trans isomerase